MTDIDLVIPMVFPQDPEWQREYTRARGDAAGAATNVRYRSWGTEGLLIRCCIEYMPWVRCIHILLASESQVQPWMKAPPPAPPLQGRGEDTQVRVVFHRDFIPEEYLPCFSSPCIEMFLHRIPGLSEHFIYANDDTFPLSPLAPVDFFREGGTPRFNEKEAAALPCQVIMEKPFPARPNLFHRACLAGLNMVAGQFGKHYTTTWLKNGHSLAPYLKSVCEEVWRRHGTQITQHLCPLKRRDDSYNQYIYAYYQHFAGIAVSHAPREQYVGPGTPTASIAAIIRDPKAGIVCINDNEKMQDWRQRAEIVRREIGEKVKR